MAGRSGSKLRTGGDVDGFLAQLQHPAKALVVELRRVILAADPRIGEAVKWNAPSFRTTEFFATINLRSRQGVGLILHFGVRKNAISTTGVDIPDPQARLRWLAKDRATLDFRDADDLQAGSDALQALLREWIRHVA